MRGLLLVVASIALTVLCWGLYGPTLHRGQAAMADVPGEFARLRPFVCVGLAYFAIGVIVPIVLLYTKGEKGDWTARGVVMSLLAGALGAIGALGIIMAFTYGGRPSVVMPLVFGGAPVVNSFLTIYWAKRLKDIGPIFIAGLLMVVMGAVTVLVCKPSPPKHAPATAAAADHAAGDSVVDDVEDVAEKAVKRGANFMLQIASIACVIVCWGAYGPVLHVGQAAMHHSRLRPLLCVGIAYFAIAVIVPQLMLSTSFPEASSYTFSGTFWSLAGGAAGAIGALGIILAFNFGGKPMYVMPLVFGGAPVVTTLEAFWVRGGFEGMSAGVLGGFFAGLLLVIAGAVIVLVFAPKGAPPKKVEEAPKEPAPVEPIKQEPSSGDTDGNPITS